MYMHIIVHGRNYINHVFAPWSFGSSSHWSFSDEVEANMETAQKAPQSSPAIKALWDCFGFDAFRPGQAEAVGAAMAGRDALIVMATGGGKSICYQILALATGKAVVVVSPLISLMQDQVIRLNQLKPRSATFLGSSQSDRGADDAVGRGDYLFIYVTPEKVSSMCRGTLMERLHRSRGIGLIAVDEAHCVCEWGNDFRPEYRALSSIRRSLPPGAKVPLMALTGTATEKIREDITKSFEMAENSLIYVGPFDRPNLEFKVVVKKAAGATFGELRRELADPTTRPPSTIIYCPTTDDVEALADFLVCQIPANLQGRVRKYHAKLPLGIRESSHKAFLTGASPLVIATLAFGMGIDKPDVRRVIHFGSPATLEAYYQQAGRAGRDGFKASCELHFSPGEFLNYRTSKFYRPDHISAEHRNFLDASCNALQRFAEDTTECRQVALVKWFGQQELKLGEGGRCGVCDNCVALATSGTQVRDYSADARLIVDAVKFGRTANQVVEHLCRSDAPALQGTCLNTKVHKTKYIKELLQLLKKEGYFTSRNETMEVGTIGKIIGYEKFFVTPKGRNAGNAQTMLPLLRRGSIIESEMRWARHTRRIKEKGDKARLSKLNELLDLVIQWREEQAIALSMAPFSVLADHIARTVAITCERNTVSAEGLAQAGVRGQVATLHTKIHEWQLAHGLQNAGDSDPASAGGDPTLSIPAGWKPGAWSGAKKVSPQIMESFNRFMEKKEDVSAIAMKRDKPVQVGTVVGHLMDAVGNGMVLDFSRIPCEFQVRKSQWDLILQQVESSDIQDAKVALKPIYEACQEKVSYDQIRTVLTLLRTGFPREPAWEQVSDSGAQDAKRPRLVATSL